jgi:phosphoribosylanthranilate isomerase
MNTKVKICGIRSLHSAMATVAAGADFLGFNFVDGSKRYISPVTAQIISKQITGKIKIVGIFQDAPIAHVNHIAQLLQLDYVQLHGTENSLYIKSMTKPVIKSFQVSHNSGASHVLSNIQNLHPAYVLLDEKKDERNISVNDAKAALIARQFPIFLAGSLDPQNVKTKIKNIQPYAVDVARGIETDGVEDIKKIHAFIANTKGANT